MSNVVSFAKGGGMEPKMMPGSQDGKYFPFARNGDVLLGVRPSGVFNGAKFGVAKTTYFACRLRSAPNHGLFPAENEGKKVVTLKKQPENVWSAWPKVTWEKQDHTRASTTVGAFIRGEFLGSNDMQKLLLDEIADGKLTTKLTDYLVDIAGRPNMLVKRAELKAWLDSQFNPMIDSILKQIEQKSAVEKAMSATVGNFGMQAALLKKVFEESAQKTSETDDQACPGN
jgi:hypothetical protein